MRSFFNFIVLAVTIFNQQLPQGPKPRYVIPVQDAKNGKAIINIYEGDGRCTGFYIAPHLILTCAHCFEQHSKAGSMTGGFSVQKLWAGTEGTVSDIAIVYTPIASQYYLKLATEAPPAGFPLVELARNPELFALPLAYVADYADGSYVVTGRVRPGDSGSPVLNLDNEVIGVAFAYNSATGEYAFVAPIQQVYEQLKKLKLELPKQQDLF